MRLNFRYVENGRPGNPTQALIEVTNAETGESIDFVQAVEFTMNAGEFLPRLTITVIPERVEINGTVHHTNRTMPFHGNSPRTEITIPLPTNPSPSSEPQQL